LKEKKMTDEMSLTVFDPLKAELAALDEKDASLVFDHKTLEGEKNLRSYVRKLRGYKGDIGRIKDDAKREAITFGRKIQAIHNELIDGVQKIIDARMKPLDEIEEAKRLKAEVEIDEEAAYIDEADRNRQIDLTEREAAVKKAQDEIDANAAEAKAKQDEIDKEAREKRIALDAAEKATKDAEAKAAADAAQKQTDADEMAAALRRRAANKKHRKSIEDEVAYALSKLVTDQTSVGRILRSLGNGTIPHVTINY
jgi:hypothetical protein